MISRVANGTVWIDNGDFSPIPQLTVSDADLMAVFLSPDGVYFLNKTNDPWYRGIVPSRSFKFFSGGPGMQHPDTLHNTYTPEEAASPMFCALRYQYCNSSKQCGSLASFIDALTSALSLFHGDPSEIWSSAESSHQPDGIMWRFNMFQNTIHSSTSLMDLINTLGPSSLLSTQHFMQGFMGPLPDNQWQLDVSHWFAMHMASIQAAFVTTAHGVRDEALLPYVSKPRNEYQWTMCNNQVSKTFFV